jgi:uncharacterized membrane protein
MSSVEIETEGLAATFGLIAFVVVEAGFFGLVVFRFTVGAALTAAFAAGFLAGFAALAAFPRPEDALAGCVFAFGFAGMADIFETTARHLQNKSSKKTATH